MKWGCRGKSDVVGRIEVSWKNARLGANKGRKVVTSPDNVNHSVATELHKGGARELSELILKSDLAPCWGFREP